MDQDAAVIPSVISSDIWRSHFKLIFSNLTESVESKKKKMTFVFYSFLCLFSSNSFLLYFMKVTGCIRLEIFFKLIRHQIVQEVLG